MYLETLLLYRAVGEELPPSQEISEALKYWLDGDYRDNSQSVWNFKACGSPLVISMCASWGWEAWVHLTGALQNSFSFTSLEPPECQVSLTKEQQIEACFESGLNLNSSVAVFISANSEQTFLSL